MALHFGTVASGSSGNCIFIGSDNTRVLIDAGLSGKRIEAGLSALGIEPQSLDAILITHEHSDHIQGAGILSRRFDVPVYATPGTWEAMERFGALGKMHPWNKLLVYSGERVLLNDLCINPFAIPHDAAEPVGYTVETEGYKVAVATDIGKATPLIEESIAACDVLLIEANHDLDMLENGPYPVQLKRRIRGDFGHLSNVACGELLTRVYSERLACVYLGHLSEENNRPMVAFETVNDILTAHGIDTANKLRLAVADRHKPGRLVSLRAAEEASAVV